MTQPIIDISFERLFYAYPTASLLCNSQGDILMANQAAVHLMQYKALACFIIFSRFKDSRQR